jgi:hypothetical protein
MVPGSVWGKNAKKNSAFRPRLHTWRITRCAAAWFTRYTRSLTLYATPQCMHQVIKKLGKGAQGSVFLAKDVRDGKVR